MSNPLTLEEPFWNRERVVSGVVSLAGVSIAGVVVGGETALRLGIIASAPIACLWVPYAVAHFPLAGAMFIGRPASHESSEESVTIIGWILLGAWAVYSLVLIGTDLVR